MVSFHAGFLNEPSTKLTFSSKSLGFPNGGGAPLPPMMKDDEGCEIDGMGESPNFNLKITKWIYSVLYIPGG